MGCRQQSERWMRNHWAAGVPNPRRRKVEGSFGQGAGSLAQMIQRSKRVAQIVNCLGPSQLHRHPTWSLSASDPFLWSPDVASLQYASGNDPDTDQEGSSDRVSSSHVQSEQQASKCGTCGLPQTVGGVSQAQRRPGLLLLSLGYKRSEVWRDQRHTERQ